MATLILTAVGTAVGGPIGGAIGALIGQQADAVLLAPKPRQGPRLGDLAVQTSSYGSPIPKIFGRMRVAGTVIWATDLTEHRSTSGGGKGRPGTTNYSYSASFAVALSARPITGVGRIWADGKLLRGAAGDFKTETRFRLHLGSEDQDVDPLIAADEGIASTPAYRGLAYAVFEDLQLADFGNRIPSLSFEVEADPGPITIGAIAATLSEGEIEAGDTPAIGGYAASGDSVRGALEPLAELMALSLTDDGSTLALRHSAPSTVGIAAADTGTHAEDAGGRTEFIRRALGTIPDEVSVAYSDPGRDWQTSLQRASIGGPSQRTERVPLPAALDAGGAKSFAKSRLAALRAARATAKLHLGWRYAALAPGDTVVVPGETGMWRINGWTLRQMVLTLDLVRIAAGATPTGAGASAGAPLLEPDLRHGPTVLRLLDVPIAIGTPADRPQLLAAAAGLEPGWRRADLSVSLDGGISWSSAGRTALPAVIGMALSTLGSAGSALIDLRHAVEIELLNDAMWLESRDDRALAGGANLALVGDELIQFGSVQPLGAGRFRLSKLLRGRRGTEWAADTHEIGETFVLIEPETVTTVDAPISQIGAEMQVSAHGLGDDPDVTETRILSGQSLQPPTPVHLRAKRSPDGDISIDWVRRSRTGWAWLDASDTPLGEESERYQLRLSGAEATRTVTVTEAAYVYPASEQAGDGGGPLTIEVAQIGTFAASRSATITVERP